MCVWNTTNQFNVFYETLMQKSRIKSWQCIFFLTAAASMLHTVSGSQDTGVRAEVSTDSWQRGERSCSTKRRTEHCTSCLLIWKFLFNFFGFEAVGSLKCGIDVIWLITNHSWSWVSVLCPIEYLSTKCPHCLVIFQYVIANFTVIQYNINTTFTVVS